MTDTDQAYRAAVADILSATPPVIPPPPMQFPAPEPMGPVAAWVRAMVCQQMAQRYDGPDDPFDPAAWMVS